MIGLVDRIRITGLVGKYIDLGGNYAPTCT